MLTHWSTGEIAEVKHTEEQLIGRTHCKQDILKYNKIHVRCHQNGIFMVIILFNRQIYRRHSVGMCIIESDAIRMVYLW